MNNKINEEYSYKKLQIEKYFRSSDLAELSNFIFSETISIEKYYKKDLNHYEMHRNNNFITYINPEVSLSDGDIVFSKTDYVKLLFKLLKGSKVRNLTLITHQSDIKIGKNLYSKKPKAISRWFAVNVSVERDDLFPIPIGFANEYYKKNLNPELFANEDKVTDKINQIYLNFNPNTNYLEREKILRSYKDNTEFFIALNNLSMSDYVEDLKKYKYVLCPPGNGIQTHRLWEALYFGAIPIVKDDAIYNNFKKLNIIFINDFKNLKIDNLNMIVKKNIINHEKLFREFFDEIFKNLGSKNLKKHIHILSSRTLTFTKSWNYSVAKFNKLYKPVRSKFFKLFFAFIKIFKIY